MDEDKRVYGWSWAYLGVYRSEDMRMYELMISGFTLRLTLMHQRDIVTTASLGVGIHRFEISWALMIWEKVRRFL